MIAAACMENLGGDLMEVLGLPSVPRTMVLGSAALMFFAVVLAEFLESVVLVVALVLMLALRAERRSVCFSGRGLGGGT